jgi:hypothetical protein
VSPDFSSFVWDGKTYTKVNPHAKSEENEKKEKKAKK